MGNKAPNYFLYFVACAVNLASFSAGIAYTWTSPTIPQMNGSIDPENNPLSTPITPSDESWLAALLSLGATLGAVAFGYTSGKYGRKNTLLAAMVPLTISFIVKAFANNVYWLYFARLFGGFGTGAVFLVVPIYMGEIAEDRNRGALGCFMVIFCCLGFLFSYSVGPFLTQKWFSLISALPSVIFIAIVTFFIPDSAHYYISKNQEQKAENSLMKLRNCCSKCVTSELMDIKKYVEESFANRGKMRDFLTTRGLGIALTTNAGLMVIQQFSGITVLLSYMQSIFVATGSEIPSDISTIIIGIVQLVFCGVTSFIIDRLGRRILLLISAVGTSAATGFIGVYFYMKENGFDTDSISWLPIMSLVLFMGSYSLGFGPLPWVILGEIFPPNMKSIASTITTATCLGLACVVTMVFPYLIISVGMAASFWLFSCCCLLGAIFVATIVPETKGKSLHEIQVMLNRIK